MKLLLAILLLAVTLQSQIITNGKSKDLAYQTNDWDITAEGFIIFRRPEVVKAQLRLFDIYFMPSPTNNVMIEMQKAEDLYQKKIAREKQKSAIKNKIIIGAVAIIVLETVIIFLK